MRALIARGVGELVVDDVPEPTVGPNQVLVATRVSAVSAGTENRMMHRRPGDAGETGPELPAIGAFGYLAAGDVVAVGADVDTGRIGERVSCGRVWGAHRQLLDIEAPSALPIPDDMSYLEGAASYWAVPPLAGILAAAPRYYADTAVIGLGPLGLAAVQMLLPSSRSVVGIDRLDNRVSAARRYGAIAINGAVEEAAATTAAAQPDGPEIVIEASGSQAGLQLALDIVRPLGRIALVGVPPPLDGIDLFWPMQHKGVKLVPIHRETASTPQGGGAGSPRQTYLPDVIDMIHRGRLDIAGMTSWVVPVESAPAAFELLHRRPDLTLGTAIAWDGSEISGLEDFADAITHLD